MCWSVKTPTHLCALTVSVKFVQPVAGCDADSLRRGEVGVDQFGGRVHRFLRGPLAQLDLLYGLA